MLLRRYVDAGFGQDLALTCWFIPEIGVQSNA
jgi:hypothetical protein